MQKSDPGVYTIRIRRSVTSEATIRITAPHSEAAIIHAQNDEDLPAKFRTIRTRVTHEVVQPDRRLR